MTEKNEATLIVKKLISALSNLLDSVDDIRGVNIRDYCEGEVENAELVLHEARLLIKE